MKIHFAAAARVIQGTALVLGACVLQIAYRRFFKLPMRPAMAAGFLLAVMAGAGFPQGAEAQKLNPAQAKALEDWTYSLAANAVTWGSPLVIMYALRSNDATGPNVKAAPNNLWRMENAATPALAQAAGYVCPNASTIYGFGFLDLRQEPVVLDLPDSQGRYYMVETVDMWTNAFAYPAGLQAGYKGGKVAFVGPNWKGDLPAGVKRIDAPTPWVLIQPRVHLPNQGELEAARKVLAGIKPQTLSEYLGKPRPSAKYDYAVPQFVNPKLPVSALDFKDPLQFWDLLSAAMNENPPPKAEIEVLLPMYKPLGLELGKQWDRSKVDPIVLKSMARAAQELPKLLNNLPFGRLTNGWFIPPPTIGDSGTDYEIRAIIARIGLTANAPKEAVYFAGTGMLDSDGNPLTGAKKYTITFKETPPFIKPGFWQLRMWDGTSCYPIANPINRYVIGSDVDMKRNPDGSVTIYIQADSPGADKESNWLPSPRGSMIMVISSYAPGPAMVESLSNPNAYVPPPVVPVK